jgi:hypothetical protein
MNDESVFALLDDSSVKWVFAKTYANFAPHYYLVKDKLNREQQIQFGNLAEYIYKNGEIEIKWKRQWRIIKYNGKKYWFHAIPLNEKFVSSQVEGKKFETLTIEKYSHDVATILNRADL